MSVDVKCSEGNPAQDYVRVVKNRYANLPRLIPMYPAITLIGISAPHAVARSAWRLHKQYAQYRLKCGDTVTPAPDRAAGTEYLFKSEDRQHATFFFSADA